MDKFLNYLKCFSLKLYSLEDEYKKIDDEFKKIDDEFKKIDDEFKKINNFFKKENTPTPIENETLQTFLENISEQDKILALKFLLNNYHIHDFYLFIIKEVLGKIAIKYHKRIDFFTLNIVYNAFKNYLKK